MRQLPHEQEYNHLERRFTRELEETRAILDARLQILEATEFEPTSFISSPNYLPNGFSEWSKLAYETASTTPSTAGDTNRECYNWYRQTTATTELLETAANALKRSVPAAQHSLWAANEGTTADIPIWDGVNGGYLLGSSAANYDIACPLPTDFVFPGQRFYVYMEVAFAGVNVAKTEGLQLYCGFWDNTVGKRTWIVGSAFTPTISVYGAPGTRTLNYKVMAETDSGEQILSTEVTVTTAPATLSAENHVRLSFSGAPGYIRYVIYRNDGANYYRVGDIRNSIDLQFFDIQETGSTVVPVAGYPGVTSSAPSTYTITSDFQPGALSSTAFKAHTFTIQVPTNYDRGATTSEQQWFRFGLSQLITGGDERGFHIRRISVSEGYGPWTRSPLDMQAASSPTSSATGAPLPGETTPVPPPPGGGFPTCVVLDTLTERIDPRTGKQSTVPIDEVKQSDWVKCGAQALPVRGIRHGTVQETWLIKAGHHTLRCTGDHRLITSCFDRHGTAACHLKPGDKLLDENFKQIEIDSIERVIGEVEVMTLSLPKPNLFLTNGLVSHNRKRDSEVVI